MQAMPAAPLLARIRATPALPAGRSWQRASCGDARREHRRDRLHEILKSREETVTAEEPTGIPRQAKAGAWRSGKGSGAPAGALGDPGDYAALKEPVPSAIPGVDTLRDALRRSQRLGLVLGTLAAALALACAAAYVLLPEPASYGMDQRMRLYPLEPLRIRG
jgi:hypothetical protein